MAIKIVPLGAGQDVGRSCVLVTIGGRNIMFDCGMHMGYNDERRFPDFTYISKQGNFDELLDCVIISHFHLDHCGALPFFTEMCGYNGPVYMTHPTKAICPLLLEDYRKITVDRKGETNFFTSQHIKDCMKKVIPVNLHQTVKVDEELEIKAYYAGHVLGAAMFYVRVGQESVVYTGDYNMTPDRHLGSAWIDKVQPDVLITESTYATTIRDSKRSRERDFIKQVHDCVSQGGKVIIPVFALGRAQELCILLETYWERMDLRVPIYFSAGLTERANHYYKLFIGWTNEKIKSTFVERNMFDFKHISAWDRAYADQPGPMVLFATPGMLHIGVSLEVFKKWAPDPKNMVIMPGFCVAGTVGSKVLKGAKEIPDPQGHYNAPPIRVNLQVRNLSFSAHADAKGIMQLIRQCEPRNVVLVHGEKDKMGFLRTKIVKEFGIDCFYPANGTTISLETSRKVPVDVSTQLLKQSLNMAAKYSAEGPTEGVEVHGVLVMRDGRPKLLEAENAVDDPALPRHKLTFSTIKRFNRAALLGNGDSAGHQALHLLKDALQRAMEGVVSIEVASSSELRLNSLSIRVPEDPEERATGLQFTWDYEDDSIANRAISIFQAVL
ncbi:uncharacterized protein VTP21DRAFT_7338 [Calcarisporiella thermophila]|uniref:uncharacterized protein n=1 Tax=Calcarisporiella thermophila TaxID=911321 RepID=UPI003743E8EB